jgi:hypothetical protein
MSSYLGKDLAPEVNFDPRGPTVNVTLFHPHG